MPTLSPLKVSYGGYSSAGLKANNEDAFSFKESNSTELTLKGHIGVIADGVSSANCAQQASQLAVCNFVDEYLATPETWSVEKSATAVLSSLNRWLYSRQRMLQEDLEYQQWFTTFSAVILREHTLTIFHIGDCQIVKIDHDGYQVLTHQHSSNDGVLNRALGASSRLDIDRVSCNINTGDKIILSCDGVHEFVTPAQITDIINRQINLEKAAKEITQLALTQGSPDNVTCLLININSVPKQQFQQLLYWRKQQIIPPAMPVGATLDHYKILELYEQTTRSHIYLAQDTTTNKKVVLKVPSLYCSDDEYYIDAFIKEGWVGQKVNHNAIMKIHAHDSNSQFLYHTCQVIEGITLAQWHSDNPQPPLIDISNIAIQIVAALRALQRKDISHGDLKLDNFMIDRHNNVTLIDLGSCEIGAIVNHPHQLPLGTLTYSAPERFYNHPNTHQSDLYSLGVIVYQLLSNQFPYKTITHIDKAPTQYRHWRYRPLLNSRKNLSPWIDIVLAKCVAADPKNRYQSYSEFITDLSSPTNDHYINEKHRPLVDSDPVMFYKFVSAVLFILLIVSMILG